MKGNNSNIPKPTDASVTSISPRVLKVIEIGDFWAKRTMPSIRLQGKWMLRAGVLPNHHVQITNPSPGILLIRLLGDSDQITESKNQQTNPVQQ